MSEQREDWLTRVTAPAAVAVFFVLLFALTLGIAPNIDTRLVQLGEELWPGYAGDLRTTPEEPTCDLEDLEARAAACEPSQATPDGDDPFGGDDPFAEDAPAGEEADPFGGDDPFAEEPAAPNEDPFAGDDPFAEGDPFADDGGEAKPDVNCAALQNLVDRCRTRHDEYTGIMSRITPANKRFRAVELQVANVAQSPWWKHLLVLLVVLGAITTTAHRVHISLRNPRAVSEHRLSQAAQLLAHGLLLFSCVVYWDVQRNSDAEVDNPELTVLWAVGFAALCLINLIHLVRTPSDLDDRDTTPVRLLMVVPLYAWLAVISGLYFLLVEGHHAGQAIYLYKFIQVPSIYLAVGLYIWAGMLFSLTRMAHLAFDLIKPWGFPPAILSWLVVVLSALPTAYSGASGIFVLAAGAVLFEQLRIAGAPPRMALAATAMSGSLGVVLRPCLVVVLIATLNKQVTTAELFGVGFWVFILTGVLALIAFLVKHGSVRMELNPMSQALPAFSQSLRRLVPYGVITLVVLLIYGVFFATTVSEHSAFYVLPGLLLALVWYDRKHSPGREDDDREVLRPLVGATSESSHHVGAILMLMTASVCLGGVVERAEVMALVPESFGSMWLTMAVLVVVMVIVGMTMDALGAVVLVSVSLATVAYDNGIHPVHFWMMVLVAFELGYLTPPVSLNHLLARQVIGEPAQVEDIEVEGGFIARYEHIVLPMAVMAAALIIVAFVPLFFYPLD